MAQMSTNVIWEMEKQHCIMQWKQVAFVAFIVCLLAFLCAPTDKNARKGKRYFGQIKIILAFLQILAAMPGVFDNVPWPKLETKDKPIACYLDNDNKRVCRHLICADCADKLHNVQKPQCPECRKEFKSYRTFSDFSVDKEQSTIIVMYVLFMY